MNIEGYLKKHGISFSEAGKQLNITAEALRAYSSRARYANPEIQEIIIDWSKGEISKESFKEAYRYTGHIVSDPLGEMPKSFDLVSFVLNMFGNRVKIVNGGHILDGKLIQTKEIYQMVQDRLVEDGSNMVINYPGVVRR
jgi:hypothetical protein